MPKIVDWMYLFYVNIAIIFQIGILVYLVGIKKIKDNWSAYRCNPIYMGFADNIEENFVYCIQNSQTNFMSYILQPVNYALSLITGLAGNMTQSMDYIRVMLSSLRTMITDITSSIFGIFLNIIIEFQKIVISIKDLVGKLVGILTALLYIIESVFLTMQSVWNGEIGTMVQSLCFSPNTLINLKNGNRIEIKNVKIGDILENESLVIGTLQLLNNGNEELYEINSGISKIHVTGSHYVFCNDSSKYIEVKNYRYAKKIKNDCNSYVCLLTNNHKILIDGVIFWDYDDDCLRYNFTEK
jgi:hypothetical protein